MQPSRFQTSFKSELLLVIGSMKVNALLINVLTVEGFVARHPDKQSIYSIAKTRPEKLKQF